MLNRPYRRLHKGGYASRLYRTYLAALSMRDKYLVLTNVIQDLNFFESPAKSFCWIFTRQKKEKTNREYTNLSETTRKKDD